MRGKKLTRQFEKVFGACDPEVEISKAKSWLEAQPSCPPNIKTAIKVMEKFKELLTEVDTSYAHYSNLLDVVNSLGEGFFAFDKEGVCLPIYSSACKDLVETIPALRDVADVLKISEKDRQYFLGWIDLLFQGSIGFFEIAELGPKNYPHSSGRYICLDYKPMYNNEGQLEGIAVVATDRTQEREARLQAEENQAYANSILKLAKDRNQFFNFVKETRRMIGLLRKYSRSFTEGKDLSEVRRLLHTIKGAAASFYIKSIKDLAHTFEEEIATFENPDQQLQVSTEELKDKMSHYQASLEGELNRFLTEHRQLLGEDFEKHGQMREISLQALYDFAQKLDTRLTHPELKKEFIETLVAIPISRMFSTYDSVIRQISQYLRKRVDKIQFMGEDIRILAEHYHDFFTSLIHIFHNAIDHGIEPPEERVQKGKEPVGGIVVTVFREETSEANFINITIEDDGRGIDPNKVRKKLLSLGLNNWADTESDHEVIQHIFDQDLSTTDVVSELSGRGIGLNAVQEAVHKLKGTIEVRSFQDNGTAFLIRLPHIESLDIQMPKTQAPRAKTR